MRPLPTPPHPTLTARLHWLPQELAPHAGRLDRDTAALRDALDRAASAGMLGATAPGPHAPDAPGVFALRAAAARASGAFAFLLTQHWSAVGFATHGGKKAWVDRLATGEARAGIAYAHLRRLGVPLVRATRTNLGLRLEGTAPWMTGWGLFDHCVTAGRLPDGRIATAIHRLDHPGVQAGPPLEMAAFGATNTVRLDLQLEVPEADVLFVEAADWLERRDAVGAARGGAFILGTAEAAVDLVQAAAEAGRRLPPGTLDRLRGALADARAQLLATLDQAPDAGLDARAAAIALAGRASHAAVLAWAGQANLADHPAQRVYREVLAFSVLALTPAVRTAGLLRLAGPPR
jgi:hypothetical protein